jgi:hypothetical protein
MAERSREVHLPVVSDAMRTPVAPFGFRKGAASLADRTLGAFAGRNDAVSLRTTLAIEGRKTTDAIVTDIQKPTTAQR